MTPFEARIFLARMEGLAAARSGFADAHAKVAADWRNILAMPEAENLSADDKRYYEFLAQSHEGGINVYEKAA